MLFVLVINESLNSLICRQFDKYVNSVPTILLVTDVYNVRYFPNLSHLFRIIVTM